MRSGPPDLKSRTEANQEDNRAEKQILSPIPEAGYPRNFQLYEQRGFPFCLKSVYVECNKKYMYFVFVSILGTEYLETLRIS